MDREYEQLKETKMSTQEVYSGKLLHVFRDEIRLPNGRRSTRELIRHVGAACVVALSDDNRVVIERQFRYPYDRVITEIPAGKLDSPDEDPLTAAKRELAEETGIEACEWIPLGEYYPSVAYSDERIYTYLARGLRQGRQSLDEDEFLNVSMVPLGDLVDDIMEGRICDGKTQSAVLKAAVYLKNEERNRN